MMQTLLKLFIYFSAFQSLVPFLKPKDRSTRTLLWFPKLFAGALSPINGIICGLGAFVGLVRRDWKLASAGLIGVALVAKFVDDIPESQAQFEAAFGSDWEQKIPAWLVPRMMPARISLPAKSVEDIQFQQNLIIGKNPKSEKDLLADLWLPNPETSASGLGLIYAHGSGWRVGDKDLGTRPLFQRLASQGHVVLDIAYSLWPEADLPAMVSEVNQAILWLKENAAAYGIDPQKIVLMGGSAGAHLALLAAYAPQEAAFQAIATAQKDTTVCGVIAFYPPVDMLASQDSFDTYAQQSTPKFLEKAADGMIQALFKLNAAADDGEQKSHHDMIAEMLGGTADEIPDVYRLLSPIFHAGPDCPPTLLLQGADDVFELAPHVRKLQAKLKEAKVPVVWVEFPHTDHAFDLMAPQISPVAQAATYDVERFLAMLIKK